MKKKWNLCAYACASMCVRMRTQSLGINTQALLAHASTCVSTTHTPHSDWAHPFIKLWNLHHRTVLSSEIPKSKWVCTNLKGPLPPSTPGVKQVLQNYRTCLILEARLCYQSDATHFQLFDENLENKVLSIFHLLTPPSKSLPSPDVGQFLKYCFWRFQSSLF